jgi:hypothetical protein
MSIEIASISFIESEVVEMHRIDMYAVLFTNGMWLVLEGFLNGYASTEASVDRLHLIIHDTIQPESSLVALHTWLHTELPALTN